jgi:integrase/recombinase XerD
MEKHRLPLIRTTEVADRQTAETPAWVEAAGGGARFAFEEFFYGQIRNPFTRTAYLRAVRRFALWCESRGLELVRVMPAHVAQHLDSLGVAPPTCKLHLAALRRFFDQLVLRHVIQIGAEVRRNPAHQLLAKAPKTTPNRTSGPWQSVTVPT